ncbi:hypothetical protein AB0I84_07625 [Streptomyces spectabilis]
MTSKTSISFSYRDWRGNKAWMEAAYRKYDFPVHTRKVDVSPSRDARR